MKHKLISLALALGLVACQPSDETQSSSEVHSETGHTESETPTNTRSDPWQVALNGEANLLKDVYFPQALHINPEGEVIEGAEKISEFWQNFPEKIDSVYMTGKEIVGIAEEYAYELGGFFTQSGKEYRHVLIWNLKGEKPVRELEFVAQAQEVTWEQEPIDARRRRWVELCNAHQAQVLVDSVYAENALYYNHRPLAKGRAEIGKIYGYMNDPKYNLDLQPLFVDRATEDLSLEIGQCSGSYGGKYVIVWQKNEDRVWRVLLDSNM